MPRLPRVGSLAVLSFQATMLLVALGLLVGGTIINAGGLVTLTVRPVRTVTPQPHPSDSTASGTSTPTTPTPSPSGSTTPTSPPTSPSGSGPGTPPSQPPQPEQPQPEQPQPEQPQQQPGGQRGAYGRPAAVHVAVGRPAGRPVPPAAAGGTLEANSPALVTAWVGLCGQTLGLLTALIGLYAGMRRAADSGSRETRPTGPRDTRPVRGTGTVRTPRSRRPRRR
ncbi:hypothetical protein ABT174_34445 [Streptomyces sparsogenes]|uniref:hypothetical protein n=1 Tax=Streptomyces sparsogenes TaxID=67365 RepID=UPI00331DCB45